MDAHKLISRTLPEDIAEWLDNEFASVPDALAIAEVMNVTGYGDTAVNSWLHNGWLKSVLTQEGKIIAKDWLIDLYRGYGYKITKMPEKHVELMVRYFKEKG